MPDRILVSVYVVVPIRALGDIGVGEFPVFLGLIETFQETFALLFFRKVKEELPNHDSVAKQIAFVGIDIGEALLPDVPGHQRRRNMLTLEQFLVHPRDQHLFVI